MSEPKEHRGKIRDWTRFELKGEGLGYQIEGIVEDYSHFKKAFGRTGAVLNHNLDTGEIETEAARYKLVGQEKQPNG